MTGFIVGVGVTGGGATEVHHLPKQPASHWSLLVLHQSPPWAPPSQVELAAFPSVPQLQNPPVKTNVGFIVVGLAMVGTALGFPVVAEGEVTVLHHLPLQPQHWYWLTLHQSPPWGRTPLQTELAPVPSLPQLQYPAVAMEVGFAVVGLASEVGLAVVGYFAGVGVIVAQFLAILILAQFQNCSGYMFPSGDYPPPGTP